MKQESIEDIKKRILVLKEIIRERAFKCDADAVYFFTKVLKFNEHKLEELEKKMGTKDYDKISDLLDKRKRLTWLLDYCKKIDTAEIVINDCYTGKEYKKELQTHICKFFEEKISETEKQIDKI